MTHVGAALLAVGVVLGGGRSVRAEVDPRQPYAAVRCDDFSVDRSVLVLPSADGVLPEAVVRALDDAVSETHDRAVKTRTKRIGGEIDGAWCISEKTLKLGKKSVTLITSAIGTLSGHGSDRLEDRVTLIARAYGNKEATRLARAGSLPRPAALRADGADEDPILQLRAAIGDRAKLAALWSTRDDVLLAGSAPGEIYQGAKARSAFRRWNLAFRIDGPVHWDAGPGDLVWALANVETVPARGAPTTMYRALFVLRADHPGAELEHDTWHLVLAHFALVEARP